MRLPRSRVNARGRVKSQPPRLAKERAKPQYFWEKINWQRARFQFAIGLFAVIWIVLWGRAFHIQIVQGPNLEEMASRQHSYTELVEAQRGNILDRNGQILARSVECRSVYANPRDVLDIQATAAALGGFLRIDPVRLADQLHKDRSFVWLERKIDDATALAIQKAALPGIGLSREYERVYPYKHLAGQLLGFVGLDNTGLEGLERSFNEVLAGQAQRNVVQRDGSGRGYHFGNDVQTRGQDLHLTLDVQIQFIAEEIIADAVVNAKARWGGVLVADAESCEILAWAQYPFFNPNSFRQSSPAEYRNRLAADALEPGSTLKPFLMATALEEKLISENEVFFCENGTWVNGRFIIRDDGRSYGNLPASKILSYSSNIGIAKVALKVGAATYYDYLRRLGFGQRTGIGVGESVGILRQPQVWSEIDLMSAAFGQSVSTTGVQMLQGYLTLANGGLYKPIRLVEEAKLNTGNETEQRVFSRATAESVLKMLEDVVDGDGTGSRARIPGLRIAGKTGTAQKAGSNQQGGYGSARMASFVGIAPAVNPRYVILVMLDEPSTTTYGGVLAAPVFQKVASRTMAYGGYLPDVVFAAAPAEVAASSRVAATPTQEIQFGKMPDVRGKSLRRAMEMLTEAGVMPEIRGQGLTVIRQQPEPGVSCAQNEQALPCVLWLSEEMAQTQQPPLE